ncbi:MAG TPA: GreA/GreB family elongation factor [Candidatus Limnocylindria bacterium]|nr:GreA/GreB family elongation factor [Candidatus Limnocylindria bacterium]
MAMAMAVDEQARQRREWPMTPEALAALETDDARLAAQVVANDGYVTGRLDGEIDAPSFVPNVVGQQLLRQLDNVRDVLARGVVVDDPAVAVIGRRVTLEDSEGGTSTYALVIPGEGDLRRGRVSVDSPVGAALLGHRVGEDVTIDAPAGSWAATIVRIE